MIDPQQNVFHQFSLTEDSGMEKYKYIFTDTYILFTVKGYDVDMSHVHTYV